jgi:CDP-glycerol glycerophosphotransferase (TagB/SpsB family)
MKDFIYNELLVIITNYACTLKCKDCANFIYKIPTEVKKQFIEPKQLKHDLENLSKVLRTNRIQVQGGESTLHKELDQIIDIVTESGISNNIQLVTNATTKLDEDVIASLKRNKTNVRISNYRAKKQNVPYWVSQLQSNLIESSLYQYAGGDDLWYDLGEYQMDKNENDDEVKYIYENCPYKVCWTLSDGLLTKCSRSASSYIAGHHDFFPEDFVNVRNTEKDELSIGLKKMLENKFMESCRYCNGISGKRIFPGVQMEEQRTNTSGKETSKPIKAAFYYSLAFQLRVLEPIAGEFEETLLSNNIEEIEEWKPDVIFTSDAAQIPILRSICDSDNIQLVGLRHGVANKYIPTDSEYSLADYVCGSQWDKDDFIQCNVMPIKEFIITGNPWIDGVFKIPKRELNEISPTILFAPTYNPEVSAAIFLKDDLVKIIRNVFPYSKIIIKPHPAILDYDHFYVSEYRQQFIDLLEQWKKDVSENKNVYLVEDKKASISDFYSETDILISDGSSLIFEFMALNRPILLYTSEQKVKIWNSLYDDKALANGRRNVGSEFKTKEEFQDVLKEAFNLHKSKHSAYQLEYSQEIFGEFTDGNSYKRVAENIKLEVNKELTKRTNVARPLSQYSNHSQTLYPVAKLYYDVGSGFSEENSKLRYIIKKTDSDNVEIDFNLKNIEKKIINLRFDPIENSTCIVEIKEVELIYGSSKKYLSIADSNAALNYNNKLVFTSDDPNILFIIPQDAENIESIIIRLQYLSQDQYLPLIGEILSEGASQQNEEKKEYISKLYYDNGKGYSEENSVVSVLPDISTNNLIELDIDLKDAGTINALRYDPIENESAVVEIESCTAYYQNNSFPLNIVKANADFHSKGCFVFSTTDPNLHLSLPKGAQKIDFLNVKYRLLVRNNKQ